MNLRNRQSTILSLPEGSPAGRKSVKFARKLYYLILFLITGYLLFFGIKNFIYIEGAGRVSMTKYNIQAPKKGNIVEYFVSVGDVVTANQQLLRIKFSSLSTEMFFFLERQKYAFTEDYLSEKARLTGAVKASERKLKSLKSLLNKKRESLKKLPSGKALEVFRDSRSSAGYASLKKEIEDMERNIELLAIDRGVYREQLREMEERHKNRSQGLEERYDLYLPDNAWKKNETTPLELLFAPYEIITSPVAGVVRFIHSPLHEYITEGETALVIESPVEGRIEAFFKLKDFRFLKEGGVVEIRFPDGRSDKGEIGSIYSSAYEYEQSLKKFYDPVGVKVKAEIYPLNNSSLQLWRKYDLLDVEVRFKKYGRE